MRRTEDNFNFQISKKLNILKRKLEKDIETYHKHKEDLKVEDEEKLNNLIEKMVQRSIHFDTLNEIKQKRENEMKKKKEEKDKGLKNLTMRIKDENK